MNLVLCPVSFAEANAFIATHHRHHLPPVGWKFGIAVTDGFEIRGVVRAKALKRGENGSVFRDDS